MWDREAVAEYIENEIAGRQNSNPAIPTQSEQVLITRDDESRAALHGARQNGIVFRVRRNFLRNRLGSHQEGIRLNEAADQIQTICQL